MQDNHINAITRATKSILTSHLGVEVSMNEPVVIKDTSVPAKAISVILGVNGQLEGQIICSMEADTAKSIIGTMMGGMTIEAIDDMGWSAIQEFGNWIAGTTATELSKEACTIDVTPPVINEGSSKFRSAETFVSLPLESTIGAINVHVSIKQER
ncbi:chemotaxis protein CheX [Desertibacillus haloalkaliphilus]|uniref:chemotaxis protein CheX n=1 Tax=Desertibacillus haloalkaliphilus TaxID=1328930 RepID=UPI001C26F9FA|nr:chemotaxis protein CheC [Desertibacillus haloalkaliphilus]MBU8905006.1 chemotaxis protein CheX [Desertibacillus haloalkaliphilus]